MACASLSALCSYLERSFNLRLEGDVHLAYHYPKEHMSLDAATCRALSLFPEAAIDSAGRKMADQFCMLNMFKPKTSMGKKLLRRRIFSPSACPRKLNSWYDYLDDLVKLRQSDLDHLRGRL